jgi:hypothetical protein
VAQVVGRESRNTHRRAGPSKPGPEPVARDTLEHAATRMPIVPRAERKHRPEPTATVARVQSGSNVPQPFPAIPLPERD